MADNKKYYYMRLNENYFDSETQVLLESMPDGYLYSNILLKLYLKSLKNDGRLMFNDKIPYSPQMIATITRHQVGTVEKALEIFKELNIIDLIDTGAIYMLDIQNFIGKSNTEADRKRAYRKRIEIEKGQMSLKCPLEIEKEIEIKKDIELEQESEPDEATDNAKNLFIFLESNFGRTISPIEYERLIDWQKTFNDDIIKYAIELSCNANAKNMNYLNAILNNWNSKGYKKLQECKDESLKKQNKRNTKKPIREEIVPDWFNQNIQKEEMTPEELAEMEELLKPFKEEYKPNPELQKRLKEKYGKNKNG